MNSEHHFIWIYMDQQKISKQKKNKSQKKNTNNKRYKYLSKHMGLYPKTFNQTAQKIKIKTNFAMAFFFLS